MENMETLLQELSYKYRCSRLECRSIEAEIRDLVEYLSEEKYSITHVQFVDKRDKIERLKINLAKEESYANGLSDARELLMDLTEEIKV